MNSSDNFQGLIPNQNAFGWQPTQPQQPVTPPSQAGGFHDYFYGLIGQKPPGQGGAPPLHPWLNPMAASGGNPGMTANHPWVGQQGPGSGGGEASPMMPHGDGAPDGMQQGGGGMPWQYQNGAIGRFPWWNGPAPIQQQTGPMPAPPPIQSAPQYPQYSIGPGTGQS